MDERFYQCHSCGNLAILAIASGITNFCCGDEMSRLAKTIDQTFSECHAPVIEELTPDSITIKVGEIQHPMVKDHNIRFICLETNLGGIIRYITPNSQPEVTFKFKGRPLAVYAYCNKHGLWKTKVENYKTCETANDKTFLYLG